MKIRRLSNNLVSANDSLESISLSPNVQLIFGPIDADTTNVRDSIRWLFFGENASKIGDKFLSTEVEIEFPTGRSTVTRTNERLQASSKTKSIFSNEHSRKSTNSLTKTFLM